MAADEERNRKIAIALGYYIWTNRPTGRLFIITGRDEDMECDLIEMLDEIDFSKPEWQIKIQEKVEGGWCGGREDNHWITTEYKDGKHTIALRESREACWWQNGYHHSYEDALLWLHERKVRHD